MCVALGAWYYWAAIVGVALGLVITGAVIADRVEKERARKWPKPV